ncbi:MAG TPA: hypothetical protein VML95_12255 [Longimicrobiales bacterium]|nr:hypothetical protein [Longimicrobiales bacterium]
MYAQRAVSASFALLAAFAASGCDISLTDPDRRVTGDYDALWLWYFEVPSLGIFDDGGCEGILEITSQRGSDFSGRHRLTSFGACMPDRSGRVRGNVFSDGDFDMEVELEDGRFGVFEAEPGCRFVRRDRRLEGRFRRGQIDAFAGAHLRCFLEGADRDVFVELDLLADERRRF